MQTVRISENRQLELLLMVFRDDANEEIRAAVAEAPSVDHTAPRGRRWRDNLADAHFFAGLGKLLCNELQGAAIDFRASTELYESAGDRQRQVIALLGRSIGLWQTTSNDVRVKADKRSSKYRKAFDLCKRSNEIAGEITWTEGIAAAQEILGTFYRRVGDHVSALEAYDACRMNREVLKDNRGVGKAFIAIGTLYEALEQFEMAERALREALTRYEACGDRTGEVDVRTRLASLFCSCGKRDEAKKHALRSIAIYDVLGERLKAAEVMLTISRIYEGNGEKENDEGLDVSLDFAMKVIALLDFTTHQEAGATQSPGDQDTDTLIAFGLRAAAMTQIGRIYNHMRKYQQARLFLENALLVALNIGDRALQVQLHEQLAESWAGAKDFQKAYEHHCEFARIRKEVAGEERQQELAALQTRFDLERAERDRMRIEEMEREMRHIENDLAMMVADLQKKNEFLKRLEALANTLTQDRGKRPRTVATKILEEIGKTRMTDPTRVLFESQRDLLHRDFTVRLAAQHPALTKREIEVCSVIKLNLTLTAEDLAGLLCITNRTVNTHRSNIRKKIGLRPDNDLGTYLTGI